VTTAEDVFHIKGDPLSLLSTNSTLLPPSVKMAAGISLVLPAPTVATTLSDMLIGIMVHQNHAIYRLRVVRGGKILADLKDSRHFTYLLSPDGKSFIGVDSGGKHIGLTTRHFIYRFFSPTGKVTGEVKASPVSWDEVSFSPDGSGFLINDQEGLSFYESDTAKRLWMIPRVARLFATANGDGGRTVIVSRDNVREAQLYERGRLSWTMNFEQSGIKENIRDLAISPNGQVIAVSGDRTLLIFEGESSSPSGRYSVEENLAINSISINNKGIVAVGAQQANLKSNEAAIGRALLLNRKGSLLFQENTQHERSNAWIPKVQFDSSGGFVLIQTLESASLRRIMIN
jgi:hypothetical protein